MVANNQENSVRVKVFTCICIVHSMLKHLILKLPTEYITILIYQCKFYLCLQEVHDIQ